jgi:hypothetical protein
VGLLTEERELEGRRRTYWITGAGALDRAVFCVLRDSGSRGSGPVATRDRFDITAG